MRAPALVVEVVAPRPGGPPPQHALGLRDETADASSRATAGARCRSRRSGSSRSLRAGDRRSCRATRRRTPRDPEGRTRWRARPRRTGRARRRTSSSSRRAPTGRGRSGRGFARSCRVLYPDGRIEVQRRSDRSTPARTAARRTIRGRVRVLRPDGMLLVDRQVVGSNGRCAKMNPGTVSLEKLTKRLTPAGDRGLERLNVLMMLLPKTTCGGLWIGCGIAAVCTTASHPRASAYTAPASVRSACQ